MLKTKDGRKLAVEELIWNDVVKLSRFVDPEFATIMNEVEDSIADYRFYKVKYKFGAKIIGNGHYYLPLCNGNSIRFDDHELPDPLRTDLSYDKRTGDPLGLILNKNSEIYKSAQDRVQSYQVLKPGDMFGIPRAIDKTASEMTSSVSRLNLNAGGRSILMLSKISDQEQHHKLQTYFKTDLPAPKSFLDQWAVFVDICRESEWYSEIILFPENFINKIKSSEWLVLSNYLIQKHRASYGVSHYKSGIWNSDFNEIEHDRGLIKYKMRPLLTAKHLIYLAAGGAPGLKPAITDDSAPIAMLKKAYIDLYKIAQPKHNIILMDPTKFNNDPIYFSLSYPTFTQNYLEASNKKSNIELIEEVKWLLHTYIRAILNNKGNIDELLYDVVTRITFPCYHSSPKGHASIFDAALLAAEDLRFTQGNIETFPITSQFFKGCVKIAKKY